MTETDKPTRESTISEIINQTFALYSKKFASYLIPFLIAGALTGLVITAINYAISLPTILPSTATPEEILNWLPGYFTTALTYSASTFLAWWIITITITQGIGTKITTDMLEKGQASLRESIKYIMRKTIPLLIAGIITGILIFIGLIVFLIPGVIFAVIFSLVVQTIIIENVGPRESLSRSRLLVSYRWLKTFGLLLLLYLIIFVMNVLVGVISVPFGIAGTIVSSTIAALVQPILPIGLTLHYYSMIARAAPQEPPLPSQII